jgi:hypothetical protein
MRLEMKYVILLMQTDLLLTQENTRVYWEPNTASTGEIMVLIQFFENDKANRELILDHLTRNSLKLHHYNMLWIVRRMIPYMTPILNYTKDATTY